MHYINAATHSKYKTVQEAIMKFACFVGAFVALQLVVSTPVPFYKPLTKEEAERLAAWTPESKQHLWQLSGQFEGDMVLTPGQRNGVLNINLRWPNRVIPYEISNEFTASEKELITSSLAREFSRTCVTVRPRTASDRDYVHVIGTQPGCWSHHQHGATDRDNYVTIMWQNVMTGMEYAFDKFSANDITSYGQPYDYDSIMHYNQYGFSKNGQPTIVPKDPNAKIGETQILSNIDIIKLNKMYKCA